MANYRSHRQCKHLKFWFCKLFCSVAKGSFSNFISTLYPKVFMLCKKKEYNGLILRPKDHHHQNNFYHGNNLNQNFQVSRFYLAVL